ncbi:MAG TPA: cytochrome c oxidase subunit II [Gemmatimonadaceae bacterium]|nr:cytochrome c oxidase subunit II [Gemmatimonadaceae bacterium]
MPPTTRVRQLVPAVFLVGLALALGACGGGPYPNSTFNHHTDFNTDVDALWDKLLFWGTLVFIVVEGVLVYTIIKFRKREGAPPPQMTHGNTALEITWTVVPIFILLIIAVPTVKTIFKTQAPAPAGSLEIEVIGHQWWWEYKYPQYQFSTANEFYIPTGRTVNFTLRTIDVLHSFWVPQMGGKRDLISTRTNHMWYTPNADLESSVWNGFCTEYCGDSHANMRIRAFTVTPAEFDQWVAGQKAPAAVQAPAPTPPPASKTASTAATNATQATATPAPGWFFPAERLPDHVIPKTPTPASLTFDDALLAQGDVERGRQLFATAACVGCHMLTSAPITFTGPTLAHIATRHTIASGIFPNDGPHLARWIKNSAKMKPGSKMYVFGAGEVHPVTKQVMPTAKLTDAQIADLVAYLRALK